MNKYHSRKIKINGMTFDSRKEANRYFELRILERAGEIKDLKRQVSFELIPTQREPDIIGPRGGRKNGKLLERSVNYVADFTYTDKSGNFIVEDTKGFRTDDYKIKRKLMLWLNGIRILET